MRFRTLVLALAVVALPALAQQPAGKPAAKPPAKPAAAGPVAVVNGVSIPQSRLEYMLRQQMQRGAPDNAQTRGLIREDLINREVVAQAAARAGVAKKRDVQTQLEITRQEVLVGAYLSQVLHDHPVTDAEVQKEYDRVRAETGISEYRARHILVDTEDEAKRIIGELQKGGKFDELAKKNSKDEGTREQGGDLDWKVPGSLEKPFAEAMVGLEKGKFTTTPVRTRYGFHVIQLDDVRKVEFPPIAQVRPQIQQRLMRQKVEVVVHDLRAKAKVQ
ncbi:MAG: peptidylprolyl isomerase [Burkholderiales bacterium]